MTDLSKYKVAICMPMMRTVCTEFFGSFMRLQNNGNATILVESGSLVYWARNNIALKALSDHNADYLLWLDSDMTFEPDMLIKLLSDAVEHDLDYVCGLMFTRSYPMRPLIEKKLEWSQDENGNTHYEVEPYLDYPENEIFEIKGSGFGAVLMKADLVREVAEKCRISPFQPLPGLSEDYSFCWRVQQIGKKMWCDPSVKVGHVGDFVFDENAWKKTKGE